MKQLDPKAVWLFFINYLISFGVLLGLIIFGIWAPALFAVGFSISSLLLSIFLLVLFVLIFSYVIAKWTYGYYRYEMSELAFKKEHGIIWKKYVSIPYDRIQNVDIYRGVFARLLGLSDIQIQTAGGITAGSYGAFSEGRLIGVSKEEAEKLRDELIQKARNSRTGQGL